MQSIRIGVDIALENGLAAWSGVLAVAALEILKSHLERTGIEPVLIFTTSSGRPISPRNLLRHTHATLLQASGVHPMVVQERLVHSQNSLTLDTYSHVIPSLQTIAADQFEEILG